jgi:hypothetical protein
MKRLLNLFSVCMLLLGLSGVANAYIINYDYHVMADGNSFTSPYSGVTVYTFDDGLIPSNWSAVLGGTVEVVSGTVVDSYQAPNGVSGRDDTKYLRVAPNWVQTGQNAGEGYFANGSIQATFDGASYNYFGLWWGSMDWYNSIAFYKDATQVAFFNGDAAAYADGGEACFEGNKCADGGTEHRGTNHYVNFLNLPEFNSFVMTSSLWSFESDNIAVGVVPEPASMLLFGLGLLGLAGLRRKFKK